MAKITLAGARVSSGLTQQEMADKMGVSREILHKWETGKAEMRTAYLMAICYITGFSVDDILLPESTLKVDKEGDTDAL